MMKISIVNELSRKICYIYFINLAMGCMIRCMSFRAKDHYQPSHIKDLMDDLDNVYKLVRGLTLKDPINLNENIIFFVHALVHKLQKHHINNFIPNSKLRRFNATPTNHSAQLKNSIFTQH
jgi:hypothetical protein